MRIIFFAAAIFYPPNFYTLNRVYRFRRKLPGGACNLPTTKLFSAFPQLAARVEYQTICRLSTNIFVFFYIFHNLHKIVIIETKILHYIFYDFLNFLPFFIDSTKDY